MSCSSCTTGSASSPCPLSASAACLARPGQSAPARSAMASRGSQTSAARSSSVSGSSGRAVCSDCTTERAHVVSRSAMGVASVRPSRSRQRSTDSDAKRRCSMMGMARSRTVSGNPPIPASAFAANVEKSRYAILVPCPTHSEDDPPRRYPLLRRPRRGHATSARLPAGPSGSRRGAAVGEHRPQRLQGRRGDQPSTRRP